MELVGEGVEARRKDRPPGDTRSPFEIGTVQKRTVEEQAKDQVFCKVGRLPEKKVERRKCWRRNSDMEEAERLGQEPGRERSAIALTRQMVDHRGPAERHQ